jgi:hypothetical protein
MTDKIIKESYLQAPFEEEKTSQSDHIRQDVPKIKHLNKLNIKIHQNSSVEIKMDMESPSPTIKGSNVSLITFEIKNHEMLKDYVVSKL